MTSSYFEEKWLKNYLELKKFFEENHSYPDTLKTWIQNQKLKFSEGKLSAERIFLLEKMNPDFFISRSEAYQKKWMEKYLEVKNFFEENQSYPDSPTLKNWIQNQKLKFSEGKLSDERISLLEKMNPDFFLSPSEVRAKKWMKKFEDLQTYVKENDKYPPISTKLGVWLQNQKTARSQKTLDLEKKKLLDETFPDWYQTREIYRKKLSDRWMKNYNALLTYYEKNGKFPSQDEDSGVWLNSQRQQYQKGDYSKEKEEALDDISPKWKISKIRKLVRKIPSSSNQESESGEYSPIHSPRRS